MAYKVFSNGDALTGSELNTYLMNQSVMVFASTTARSAALPAPVEGMLTWLQDTNKYSYYNGSGWTDLAVPYNTNAIINGAFDIWQRGTSFTHTSGAIYTADRFSFYADGSGGTKTISQQTFTPGTAPVSGYEGKFFWRFNQSVAPTGQTEAEVGQPIEDVRTFAGQTVTLSFWAKADTTRTLTTKLRQTFGTGGSALVDSATQANSLTTSWQRFTQTVTLASVAGKTISTSNDSALGVKFLFPTGVTQTIDIWGVQLEAGSVATAFKRNASSIQGELAACQRYYWRGSSSSTNTYQIFAQGSATSSTNIFAPLPVPVTMRTSPTSIEYANLAATADQSSTLSITNVTLANGTNASQPFAVFTVSGATQFRPYQIQQNNNIAGYVGVSAEL